MIGNFVTVQQLYNYAVMHNYLNTDATTVLDIMNRERNRIAVPVSNSSTVDFKNLVEYSINDLLTLLST